MKSLFAALVILGLSFASSPSKAADSRNVTVVNETGYAIKFLGFNAPDDGFEEWDNELDKTLRNQDSTYVEFDDSDEGGLEYQGHLGGLRRGRALEERQSVQVHCTAAALRPGHQDNVVPCRVTSARLDLERTTSVRSTRTGSRFSL
jgi:hypothetical protein